eukprot:COSAG02_NODE_8181_length_2673_cov_1.366744_3_plen_441_part_00
MGSSLLVAATLCMLSSATADTAGSRGYAVSNQHAPAQAYSEVWAQDELEFCGWRIRTPALVMTNTSVHITGRCCGPNLCSSKPHVCIGKPPHQHCKNGSDPMRAEALRAGDESGLGDDNSLARIVMKTSTDQGHSWGGFKVISPASDGGDFLHGYTMGHGLWDRLRERLVMQYHYFPTNTTRPAANVVTYQMISTDDGASFSAPRDISDQVRGCSESTANMAYLSAGSKIQTESGRMLWPAHAFGGTACVWFSDDGGESYQTSNILNANEISIAELTRDSNGSGERLLLNGRCGRYPWCSKSCVSSDGACNNRTRYISTDGGAHWGPGAPSALLDDGDGCARSLLNLQGVLYTAEPQGPHRSSMVLQCSLDGGVTWPRRLAVNGDGPGGYSTLAGPMTSVDGGESLLLIWEHGGSGENDDGNMYSALIGTQWCTGDADVL